eukprot:3748862-Lingulodinium_polyedra.AAC.1
MSFREAAASHSWFFSPCENKDAGGVAVGVAMAWPRPGARWGMEEIIKGRCIAVTCQDVAFPFA